MKRFAFFDFDGTITNRDTLLSFIRYTHGRFRMLLGFILNFPWLLAMRLGLVSNQTAKQRILKYFFGKQPLDSFNRQCNAFGLEVLPGLIRPKAHTELHRLLAAGFTVIIVSASPENWIFGWAAENKVELIATRLATRPDPTGIVRLTGLIEGNNCHGREKPVRIREAYSLAAEDIIYTYGDSKADLPFISLGTVRFVKPFR